MHGVPLVRLICWVNPLGRREEALELSTEKRLELDPRSPIILQNRR